MKNAFGLIFNHTMPMDTLNDTLGGLSDWENYLKHLKERQQDKEKTEKEGRRKRFKETQEAFQLTSSQAIASTTTA